MLQKKLKNHTIFFLFVTLFFSSINNVLAQIFNDIEAQTPALVISLHEGTDAYEGDILLQPITAPFGSVKSLHIGPETSPEQLSQDDELKILAQIELDFSFDDLSWITILPTASQRMLNRGFVLEGHRDDYFLYLSNFYQSSINPESSENTVAGEPLVDDSIVNSIAEENIETDVEAGSYIDLFSQAASEESPQLVVSITRDELWRRYPQKLISLLIHMEVEGVFLDIPSALNASFPLNSIELGRFIGLAQENDIQVWARIKENFQKLPSGLSVAATQLQELLNYNQHSALEAQLKGVQIYVPWSKLETYLFYKNQWFNRSADLYASLSTDSENLALDFLLPQQMLSELDDQTIFGRIGQVADSVTILIDEEDEAGIENLLVPLDVWAREHDKTYKVALERPFGEQFAGHFAANDAGSVRLVRLGSWLVLMKVENIVSELGIGFDYESFQTKAMGGSRKLFSTDLLDFAHDIALWQSGKDEFKGIVLYGLPEFDK